MENNSYVSTKSHRIFSGESVRKYFSSTEFESLELGKIIATVAYQLTDFGSDNVEPGVKMVFTQSSGDDNVTPVCNLEMPVRRAGMTDEDVIMAVEDALINALSAHAETEKRAAAERPMSYDEYVKINGSSDGYFNDDDE